MKFGILYNTDYYPAAHQSPSNYYAQLLEQTELAEKLGFDAVWFGEHHYSGYSFGSPSVIAMAAAARTRRIRLGTGVSLIPLHHPIRLAEEYAMLDVLSGGRLEYGIGRGFLKYSHDVFGIDEHENHERYREGTDLIVKAWTAGEPFSHEGRFWKLDNYSFFPKPLQQPYPPIYASAVLTPDSAIFAGSRGFNLASGLFLPAQNVCATLSRFIGKPCENTAGDPRKRKSPACFRCIAVSHRKRRDATAVSMPCGTSNSLTPSIAAASTRRKAFGTTKAGCQRSSRTKAMRILRRSGC